MKSTTVLVIAGLLCAAGATAFAAPAAAATLSRSCPVDSVAVIENRMHIKCAPVPGVGHTQAIYYFALPLTEPAAKIQSIIALAIEAKRIKKPMTLWFDMDDYKSVPGCQGNDCRRLQGAALE
jgi:hypothetical protein